MRKRIPPKPSKVKMCPLLEQNCLKSGCEIYNELLDRCDLSVLSYNLYRLSETMKLNLEAETEDKPRLQ